jgi:hypothetical protein
MNILSARLQTKKQAGSPVELTPLCWGIVPVFDAGGEGYVNRGAFIVPLFEGAPPPAALDLLAGAGELAAGRGGSGEGVGGI